MKPNYFGVSYAQYLISGRKKVRPSVLVLCPGQGIPESEREDRIHWFPTKPTSFPFDSPFLYLFTWKAFTSRLYIILFSHLVKQGRDRFCDPYDLTNVFVDRPIVIGRMTNSRVKEEAQLNDNVVILTGSRRKQSLVRRAYRLAENLSWYYGNPKFPEVAEKKARLEGAYPKLDEHLAECLLAR